MAADRRGAPACSSRRSTTGSGSKSDILGLDPRAGEPGPAGHRRARARRRRARWPSASTGSCARTCSPCAASRSTSTRSTAWPPRRPTTSPRYWDERRRLDDEVEALIAEGVGDGELRAVDAAAGGPHAAGRRRGHPELVPPGRRRPATSPSGVADHVAEPTLARTAARPTRSPRPRSRSLARLDALQAVVTSSPLARQRVALGGEGRPLLGAEGVDVVGLGVEERQVVGEAEGRRLDADARARRPWPRPAGRAARRRSTGWKRSWSKRAQQPRHVGLVARRRTSRYHTGTVRPTNW